MTRSRAGASLLAAVAAGLWVAGSAFWWGAHTAPTGTEATQKLDPIPESFPPEPAPAAVPALPPPLALLSTSVAETPALSIATLMDQDSEATELVRPGESLAAHPEIAVSEIGPRWVELKSGASAWILELEPEPARRVVGPADLQRILGDPDLTTDDRVRRLLAAGAGERTLNNILSEASFAPYEERGQIAGLVVTAVQPDGFYARVGLARGDVIREVNGIRLNGRDALEDVAGALQWESSLHVLVESDGELRRLLVDFPPPPQTL